MKLNDYLSARGLTQRMFSASIGVTQQAVSQWLRGGIPRPAQMQSIVAATDGAVTPNDFLPSASGADYAPSGQQAAE